MGASAPIFAIKSMKYKKKFFVSVLAFLLALIALLFSSCERKPEKYTEYSFDYFDTVTTIIGYEKSREEFDAVAKIILDELGECHRLFTIYNRYEGLENLCTVNDVKDGKHNVVKVDRRIIDMLLFSKQMYDKTKGRVNVAMGSVLSIWHEYRQAGENEPENAKLPPMDDLREAAEHTDINDVVIDEENSTVFLTDPEMKLDVGAIAKGYAVEAIAKMLYEKGITGYVLNVGGNVRSLGTKPDGEEWSAGIQNPDPDSEDYLAHVSLRDKSLITSGSYQRYYYVDGKEYHHIIDPDTLMPAAYFTSVSIICESSALGDALSTALFCMSYEDGLELVESLDGVEALWVTKDGEQHKTSGF